jgi:hypothetical protein
MKTENLKAWLEKAEADFGEPIEAIVVGSPYRRDFLQFADENIVISREQGLRKVDQLFDPDLSRTDCFPLYAWTKSRVFFVAEYDGEAKLNWAPRLPIALEPRFSGQPAQG